MAFVFLNLNPLGKIEQDCVCRAISLALQEDYEVVEHKLYLIAELYDCEKLCVCCYKHLLDNVYNLMRIESYKGLTIEEFTKMEPKGTFIVRSDGHLTCVLNGEIYDTWDCYGCIIDIVWEVPGYQN